MLAFLGPDLATVLVSLLLFSVCLAIVGRAAVNRHRRQGDGSAGCGCGCAGCSGCAGCPGCGGADAQRAPK